MSVSGISKSDLIYLYREIFGDTPFYFAHMQIDSPLIIESRNLMVRSFSDESLEDGVYFGDYNFDGVSDEILSVTGNELTFLKDTNQDNITDLSIHFSNGIPTDIYLNKGDTGYNFIYSEYPYLEEIHYSNQSLKRIYKIFPGTIYTPLKDLDNFNWKYNRERLSTIETFTLTPVDLLSLSYLFEEYFSGNTNIFRIYTLKNGEITGFKEDSDNNGFFDHFLDISAWLPQRGRRDLDYDGVIDILEYYEDGKISGIAVDWNNNGKPEYLEDWSVLNIKSWDFNEDSYIDAELISSNGDIIYNENSFEKEIVNQYDLFSWNFSYENFWFNNY